MGLICDRVVPPRQAAAARPRRVARAALAGGRGAGDAAGGLAALPDQAGDGVEAETTADRAATARARDAQGSVERGGAGAVRARDSRRLSPPVVPAPWRRRAAEIVAAVAMRWKVPAREIMGRTQNRRVGRARRIAILMVKSEFPAISGRQLGVVFGRAYGTIQHYLAEGSR